MHTNEKQYDIAFIGIGVSAALFFIQNKQLFAGKTVCFIEKGSSFDLNKTIAGFAKDIPLPVSHSFSEFDCRFGKITKKYFTDMQYHILDLPKIFDQFKEKAGGCDFLFDSIVQRVHEDNGFQIYLDNKVVNAKEVFDSRAPNLQGTNYLKQHFRGWFTRFDEPHEVKRPMLMDIDQNSDHFRFVYIMPLSETELLVELTYYSSSILEKAEYDDKLDYYMRHRFPEKNFTIYDKETGIIPLINIQEETYVKNYHSLGIRNGFLRASTGYSVFPAFFRMRPNRLLQLMDQFLLKVLWLSPQLGGKIFTTFLENIDGNSLAQFMSYRPTLWSVFRAALAMPKFIFMRHLFKCPGDLKTNYTLRGIND